MRGWNALHCARTLQSCNFRHQTDLRLRETRGMTTRNTSNEEPATSSIDLYRIRGMPSRPLLTAKVNHNVTSRKRAEWLGGGPNERMRTASWSLAEETWERPTTRRSCV